MQKKNFLCSSRKWRCIIRHARLWIAKHLKYNCNTIGTEKGKMCKWWHEKRQHPWCRKWAVLYKHRTRRELCKTNSNTSCYTNSGSNWNFNNRPHDALRPTVNNNEIECSIPGPSIVTYTNNHSNSNLKNRPADTPLTNNNEIKYLLPGPSKESDKKQALK